MKKLLLVFIISFLALGLYAQETDEPALAQGEVPADSVVEELEAVAAESAETAQAQAYVQEQNEWEAEPEPKGKKTVFAVVLDYFTLPGTTRHNEAIRYIDFGFNVGGGFGNSLIGGSDILKKEVVIDLDSWNDKITSSGVDIGFDASFHQFLDVNFRESGWGAGEFVNVDGRGDVNLPKSLFDLLSKGNLEGDHNMSGEFAVSGAVFADAGFRWYGTFLNKKLRVGVAPAYYVPLVYVPKSTLKYELDAESGLYVEVGGNLDLYNIFSDSSTLGGGGDISLNGEYALFPIIDVGGTISHIPIVPAKLANGKKFKVNGIMIDKKDQSLFDGIGDIGEITTEDGEAIDDRFVVRPLRFDFYVLYRPFRRDFLTIKPSIGFTVLNPSEEAYFNGALEAQLNVARILFVTLGTGVEEGYWRHKLGFAVDARVFEFDITAGLKSQDYLKSYQLGGAEVTVGLKFGF
ncbi:hypothetical protein [Treponema primitia]|uniref:hypothetical protein n=1 Tax=Treponema primitia TaxID=88058 RepID=UPI00025553DA|nr:hypothetical protein [Treponema primitia]